MNDQRLEHALRSGPPFATQYAAPALPLDRAPAAPIARVRPMVLLLAAVALLLVAFTTALIVGTLRSSAAGLTCADMPAALSHDAIGWPVDANPSPGGGRVGMLAVHDAGSGLALLDPTTGEPCGSLSFAAGRPTEDAAWSPNGDAVAMMVGPENHRATALVVVSPAGVMERDLEPWPLNFSWSPDGRAIAVVSASDIASAQPARVWIVPYDGSAPREMTFDCGSCIFEQGGTLGWATEAAWSPDSRQIVLGFNPADDPEAVQDFTQAPRYWVGSVESGRLAEVAADPGLDLFGWSDDDSLLMVDRTDIDRWFAVPVAHPEDAVAVPRPATEAGLSPDGMYRLDQSADGELAVIDVDGGSRRVLVKEPGTTYVAWGWAPDSQSISFTKYTDATGNPVDGIWIVNLDGHVRLLNADYRFAGQWQPVGD